MTVVRDKPCTDCPYRRDCPPGLWAREEYEKLVEYDGPTYAQPPGPFMCHVSSEKLCHGWVAVHGAQPHDRELLALRIFYRDIEIPPPAVPLFSSGAEAAAHGLAGIDAPGEDAVRAIHRLMRVARIREGNVDV